MFNKTLLIARRFVENIRFSFPDRIVILAIVYEYTTIAFMFYRAAFL